MQYQVVKRPLTSIGRCDIARVVIDSSDTKSTPVGEIPNAPTVRSLKGEYVDNHGPMCTRIAKVDIRDFFFIGHHIICDSYRFLS